MPDSTTDTITRRQVLAAGLAGAAAIGAIAQTSGDAAAAPAAKPRMPVVYLPHGGGPWPFVALGMGNKADLDALAQYLRQLRHLPQSVPAAVLVVSAHWEAPVPTLMTAAQPPMFYDYYGFPPESYTITWPAPGAPALAARVQALLKAAGLPSAVDPQRGYDHGTFVPLKLTYPEANVPTLQLSLQAGLDPLRHLAIGRALAPLREEGVFIVGSGMSYHNMRGFGQPGAKASAQQFDTWLHETVVLPRVQRDQRLADWAQAPAARAAHPREEHLLPLTVMAGAAGADLGKVGYSGQVMGVPITAVHFG